MLEFRAVTGAGDAQARRALAAVRGDLALAVSALDVHRARAADSPPDPRPRG